MSEQPEQTTGEPNELAEAVEPVEALPVQPQRRLYFVNEQVEWQLTVYLWSGCTRVEQRDKIMSNATELIRQIIRKQGLHTIYPGQEESAFGDLLQTAWVQIERTLYKYRAKPHCRHCFNPDRPNDSALYNPGETEYGIKTIRELVDMGLEECPRCHRMLTPGPLIEAKQGLYGGSDTVLYRGISKVFNMWCVAPHTMIPTCHGPLTAAEVLKHFEAGLPIHVDGLDGLQPVEAMKVRDHTPTSIVTVLGGYQLESSGEHSLYVARGGRVRWLNAQDVRMGDLVAIRYAQNNFSDYSTLSDIKLTRHGDWAPAEEMTDELAYLIGVYIARGTCLNGRLTFAIQDRAMIDLLTGNSLGLEFTHQSDQLILSNVRFIELLQQLGFPENDSLQIKLIPNRLLCLPRELICSMLRGMFDAGGFTHRYEGRVSFQTHSIMLLNQLVMILLNLGMLSRRLRTLSKSNGQYKIGLSCTASDVFYDQVGFRLDYKQNGRQKLGAGRVYTYGLSERVKSLYRKYGRGALAPRDVFFLKRRKLFSPQFLRRLMTVWSRHADDPDYAYITERVAESTAARNRIVWLPVKSIARGASNLIDLAVRSRSHSYVANGIVVHNSQVARTVILAYIKKEGRDRKNSPSYTNYLDNHTKPISDKILRFLAEARELCRYHDQYLEVLDSLEWLLNNDDKPHDGTIGKLVKRSGLPRATITNMMKMFRLRALEFTDSPLNHEVDQNRAERRRVTHGEFEDEG